MKIVTVVHDLGLGGTQRCAVNFAIAYQRLGRNSFVVAANAGGCRESELRAARVDYCVGFSAELAQALGAAPDLIHVHSHRVPASLITLMRSAWPRAVFAETNVFSEPSDFRHSLDISMQLSQWCRWLYGIRDHYRVSGPRIDILPNLVTPDEFYPETSAACQATKESLNLPSHAIVIGRVGEPFEGKWHPYLIAVFRRVAIEREDAFLLLVGAPASIKSAVEGLEPSIRERCRLVSPTPDDGQLRSYYSVMDVFLHIAAIGESFGMVLAEAMLCGTPVVTLATPYGDNSQCEIVEHPDTGFVVHRPENLSTAVLSLLGDSALRTKMGLRGRERVIRRFSADAVIPHLDSILTMPKRGRRRSVRLFPPAFGYPRAFDLAPFATRWVLRTRWIFGLLRWPGWRTVANRTSPIYFGQPR